MATADGNSDKKTESMRGPMERAFNLIDRSFQGAERLLQYFAWGVDRLAEKITMALKR